MNRKSHPVLGSKHPRKITLGSLAKQQKMSNGKDTYIFPREGDLPAGRYTSVVDKVVETTSNTDRPAVDVSYAFTSPDEQVYRVKFRTAQDTPFMNQLIEALIAADADPEEELTKVSGIQEIVEFDYDENGFGYIVSRRPLVSSSSSPSYPLAHEDDEEDDDFLDEDI